MMTDYISRQEAIEALAGWKISPIVLAPVPSADVVEVVRCKDCKHFEAINNDDHGWCKMISDLPCGISVRYDDDYYSFGERADRGDS